MKTTLYKAPLALTTVALAVAGGTNAQAKDPFIVSGATTSGPLETFSVGNNSLPDLAKDLVDGAGDFASLLNRDLFANFTYFNVPDALRFDITELPTGWQARIQSPFNAGMINRTFLAATRAELEDQIEDYIKTEGAADLARWMKALNEVMPFGTLDGSPNSSTALSADYSFNEYGLLPTTTMAEREDSGDEAAEGGVGFGLMADVGFIRSEGYNAESYSATPFLPIKLASRVRLDVGLPLNYTDIEGAQVFRGGLQLAAPLLLMKRELRNDKRWLWQVTPSATFQVAGSYDLAAGGGLVGGGATSYLSYDFGRVEVGMGNQFTFYESVPLSVADFDFEPDVSSQILKNGLKVGVSIGKHWFIEAYAIDTELLNSGTYLDRYGTFGGGIGFRKNSQKKAFLMVGGYAEVGSNWNNAGIRAGTGWKF